MLIGGGKNHRMGLFDMVMIKDNHISAAGGIINAIKSVDEYLTLKNLDMDVEVNLNTFQCLSACKLEVKQTISIYIIFLKVETRTLEEVREVLEYVSGSKTRVSRIMLDNMVVPLENGDVDVTMLEDAVELISGRVETEVCVK